MFSAAMVPSAVIAAIAALTGCASPRIHSVTTHPASVSVVNSYGEVWRYSVSTDGREQWQYVGMLADRIDLPPANPDRVRL